MATVDELLASLRSNNLRITQARRIVCRILAEGQDHHMSASEIYQSALTESGGIDRSTVYRILDDLERIGALHHVHTGHHAGVYHLSDKAAHHHLVCEHCGETFPIPFDVLGEVFGTVEERFGFFPNTLHLTIPGQCQDCHLKESDVNAASSVPEDVQTSSRSVMP